MRRRAGPGTSRSATAARARPVASASSTSRAVWAASRSSRARSSCCDSRERADLAATGYSIPGVDESLWIGGGRFDLPVNARHLAWHQIRSPETETSLHGFGPDLRLRARPCGRSAARRPPGSTAFFTPRYRVSGDGGGGGIPSGGGEYGTDRRHLSHRLGIGAGERVPAARLRDARAAPQRLRLASARRARGARADQRRPHGLSADPGPQLRPERPLGGERPLGRAPGGRDRGAGPLPGSDSRRSRSISTTRPSSRSTS